MFFVLIILQSCKKISSFDETKPISDNLTLAKSIIKENLDRDGYVQKVELNKKMIPSYVDLNGNPVSTASITQNLTSTCAGDLPETADLNYYYRLYKCNTSYTIKWRYTISWNNNLVTVNPNNSANRTRGNIRISIPGNANAYNSTTGTSDLTITDLGVDPSFPSNNLFSVEFTSPAASPIPVSLVNTSGAVLRLGAVFASDCSSLDQYQLALSTVSGFGFSTPLNSSPCSRNDRTFYQNPGILEYRKIGIAGYDPIGNCSYSAGAAPSLQEVQYSVDNGAWVGFDNTSYVPSSAGYYGSAFVSQYDFAKSQTALTPGMHTIKIRYRNWKYNNNEPSFPVPTTSNACVTPVWTEETYFEMVN